MNIDNALVREATPLLRKRIPRPVPIGTASPAEIVRVDALIAAHRAHGYECAATNPLSARPEPWDELRPLPYALDIGDEALRFDVCLGGVLRALTLTQILALLRRSYCGSLALNAEHVRSREHCAWLHVQMEQAGDEGNLPDDTRVALLRLLCRAEMFEQYLATRHAGQKRFNLQGSEGIVPLLQTVFESAVEAGIGTILLGLQHRGRLNILHNVLRVPAGEVLSLYTDAPRWQQSDWDLNDHLGYATEWHGAHGRARVLLAPNPSHLESVVPVVCGMARAMQDRHAESARRIVPVLVHGDAAFCGQGIVAETLNLSQIRGYQVGGAIHIVLNNQIGSTVSNPRDARSTEYCTDVARAIDAPVLHVNADDPEAIYRAARIALEYRMTFFADVIVNLMGYRRYGHNSVDLMALTQPAMQRRIQSHAGVVDQYAHRLLQDDVVAGNDVSEMRCGVWEALSAADEDLANRAPARDADRKRMRAPRMRPASANTSVPLPHVQSLLQKLSEIPDSVAVHPHLRNLTSQWRKLAQDPAATIDWCIAENLAYASLLVNGYNVRLTGMDVGRGSFYHRHAVWHDQRAHSDGIQMYYPLRHLAKAQGTFAIFDTPLSEEAVVGFEYGYSLQCGRDLVLWEAQMGDFVNNAQVIIDQYISCGTAKWGLDSGLVLLLPHGYEGVGPEHSSASIGRFLSLCAEGNMRVAIPTTSAQLFHLLRRQALDEARKPLIVITGKGALLGARDSHSSIVDFTAGRFAPVLESGQSVDPPTAERVIVTCGKLYYDLVSAHSASRLKDVAILRVEELYPFPRKELTSRLARYTNLREVVWAQEEAKNHGPWHFVREELEAALPATAKLAYVGRPAAAACAVCKPSQHSAQQREIVAQALGAAAALRDSR